MSSTAEEIELQRTLVEGKRLRYSLGFAQYYHQWYNEVLLAPLNPDPGRNVLDCGCGTGVLIPALERRYRRVVGLDLSIDNLLEARTVIRGTSLVVGDMAMLPLRSRSFDQIVCRAAMYRLADVRPALKGIHDLLKDGGDFVLTEPISDSPALRFLQIAIRGSATCTHTSREWVELAEAAGFHTIRWFNFGYLALPLLGYPEPGFVMRSFPLKIPIARLLLRLDRIIAEIPGIKRQSWHGVFHFRKPCPGDSFRN